MMDDMKRYYDLLQADMQQVLQEKDKIQRAAKMMSACVHGQHHVYFFGTGHSYIVSWEIFGRAGGYAGFIPILENELGMNHAFKSTLIERTASYADVIMGLYRFEAGDVIVMTSNSGRNALIIELALRLKALGVKIIAITALEASAQSTSRHESGKRLFEVADLVLDIHSAYGDACIRHTDDIYTGPTSTIMSCYVAQLMVTAFVNLELSSGYSVPVFRSSNVDDGDAYNEALFDRYRK